MPILPPEYISSWYYFRDGAGFIRIFESWDETQQQDVEKATLLQGDIGTHVMNVGGIKWVTNIQSPALIVEFANGSEGVTDAFDLLVYAFNYIRNPFLTQSISQDPAYPTNVPSADYLLKEATVKVAQEGVDINMTFFSSRPGAFAVQRGYTDPTPDFIARVARFYDVQFYTSDSSQIYNYQVLSANINIRVDLSENYFINTGSQAPYFGVQGYHVSGDLELAVPPEYFPDVFIPGQNAIGANGAIQALNANNANISLLLTGHQDGLILGSTQLRSSVKRSLNPRNISTVRVDFETFTRYSTITAGA